jgi:hypothetical protein
MRLRFPPTAVFPIGIFSIIAAVFTTVTGESTTAGSRFDPQPAESTMPLQMELTQNELPADIGTMENVEEPLQAAPEAAPPTTTEANQYYQPADAQTTTAPQEDFEQQSPDADTATTPVETSETAPEQPPVATAPTEEQPVLSDTAAEPEAPPQILPGTIVITSIPDSVAIVINDVSVGSTPYLATGFYPGIYEIVLHQEGYEPFVARIDLQENGTEFITGNLIRKRGALFISSFPDSSRVLINDSEVGTTPFSSQPLLPDTYRLRIEADGYTPYTEQLTITPELTDTLQISLFPLEKPKRTRFPAVPAGFAKSRTIRRISFGSLGAVSLIGGIICNSITKKKLAKEREALESYQEARLPETTYDQRYADYLASTKTTDRIATGRNILYTIGIISGIGFAVSIPF